MSRSFITTHILDTAAGKPAAGVAVVLAQRGDSGSWTHLADGITDGDGRVNNLGPDQVPNGTYRLTFDTNTYFTQANQPSFFPEVSLTFSVDASEAHYHVPLLLSPFAFSTYRGS